MNNVGYICIHITSQGYEYVIYSIKYSETYFLLMHIACMPDYMKCNTILDYSLGRWVGDESPNTFSYVDTQTHMLLQPTGSRTCYYVNDCKVFCVHCLVQCSAAHCAAHCAE